jgi:lysophospholipase L1-like esterase
MIQDYNTHARRKKRLKKRITGYFRFALCAAAILLVSLALTKILEFGQKKKPVVPESGAASAGISAEVLAPLPMQGGGSAPSAGGSFGPVMQTAGAYTLQPYNLDTIQLRDRGQVSLDYFSDAAFLGDSLTEGFTEFKINLSGAMICGYVGIGPDAVVNRTTVTHPERGSEVILDALAANQPKKVYILLGTNTLVNTGSDEKFLAYYSQMLDDLRSTLGEGTLLYVQAIPPVRPEVPAQKPGLESSHLKAVNEQLAQLADEKGCYFVDLWDAMADGDGNLNADYAAADGIHFTAGNGYTAWINYLRSHTVYASDNEWTPGTAYAAG